MACDVSPVAMFEYFFLTDCFHQCDNDEANQIQCLPIIISPPSHVCKWSVSAFVMLDFEVHMYEQIALQCLLYLNSLKDLIYTAIFAKTEFYFNSELVKIEKPGRARSMSCCVLPSPPLAFTLAQ